MSSQALKILEEAMALSPDERTMLARKLLASVEDTPDGGVSEAWAAEITRRAERVLAGQSTGVPWDDVRREARTLLDRK